MAKNEDGEFELILGNRQLLSVFFIVVVLLGVFFTMGYIVGRNSNPLAAPEVVTAQKETKPVVIDAPGRDTEKAAPMPAAGAAPKETATQLPPSEPVKPVKPMESPKAAATEPPKREPVKSEPPKPQPVKTRPPEPVKAVPAASGQPGAGEIYLQLSATAKADADVMVDLLHTKGFHARAVRHPERPEVYRVLVGPVPESAVNKTRADLQGAGFPGDRALKKTF